MAKASEQVERKAVIRPTVGCKGQRFRVKEKNKNNGKVDALNINRDHQKLKRLTGLSVDSGSPGCFSAGEG